MYLLLLDFFYLEFVKVPVLLLERIFYEGYGSARWRCLNRIFRAKRGFPHSQIIEDLRLFEREFLARSRYRWGVIGTPGTMISGGSRDTRCIWSSVSRNFCRTLEHCREKLWLFFFVTKRLACLFFSRRSTVRRYDEDCGPVTYIRALQRNQQEFFRRMWSQIDFVASQFWELMDA